MCFAPQWRALFRHLNFKKWSGNGVLCTFWLGHVPRAKTACTFPTFELQKVLRHWCVCAFDLDMCFAPQRRALFRHLNFHKWSKNGVLCTFWLGNVLRTTMAYTFSTSQLLKVIRSWVALYILNSTFASRHNCVQLFISHLARWLCTRHFSGPAFRPSRAINHWKNTVNRDFATFRAPASSFFSLFLFSDLLTSFLLLLDSSHLCFSTCPYCRKFDF